MLKYDELPNWVINLEQEDLAFIKNFMLSSGSLKELASEYEISYPTLRLRLDRLNDKIALYDQNETDTFIEKIKALTLDDKMDIDTAKALIAEYKRVRK